MFMIIEKTKEEIVLRLPANFDTESLQKIINFLKFKEATVKSKATEKEANELAEESKINWWKENKSKYIK